MLNSNGTNAGRPAVLFALVVVVAVTAAGLLAVPNDFGYLPGAAAFAALGAVVVIIAAPADDRRALLLLFFAGMTLRVAAGITFYYVSVGLGGDGTPAGKDDAKYFSWGSSLVEAWRDGSLSPAPRILPGSTQHGYIYVNAIAFALFGQHLLAPIMFNAMVGGLMVVPVYAAARALWGRRAGLWGAALAAGSLHMAFYAALNMKDTLIAFLAVSGLAIAVRSRRDLRTADAFALVAAGAGLLALRPPAAGLYTAVVALFVGWPWIRRAATGFERGAIGRWLPFADRLADVGTGYAVVVATNGDAREDLRGLLTRRGEAAEAESGRLVRDDSYFNVIADAHGLRRAALLPLAVIYTLVQPFPPWPRFGEECHFNVLIIANASWLLIVPFAAYGFFHALRNRRIEAAPVLLFVAVWLLAIAWTYYGIQSRYRVTLEPIAMVFAGAGLVAWPRSRPLTVLWLLALALAAILYVVLKRQVPLAGAAPLALAWLAASAGAVRRGWLRPLLGLRWLDGPIGDERSPTELAPATVVNRG